MGTVSSIRKTVLPQELYDIVFGFAVGDSRELMVVVLGNDGGVTRHTFSNEKSLREASDEAANTNIFQLRKS